MSEALKVNHSFPFSRQISWAILLAVSDYKMLGRENWHPDKTYLITANHMSYFDGFIGGSLTNQTVTGYVAKKYRKTLMGRLISLVYSPIWIDQGEPDRAALKQGIAHLKAGYSVAIGPEGRRSREGRLIEGHTGVAFLADKADVEILPYAMYGTERILKEPRPKVRAIVGKPYRLPPLKHPEKSRQEMLRENTDRMMCALAALLPEQYHGFYAGNPLIDEMAEIVR